MMRARHTRILHVPRRFVAEEWGGTETVILEIARQQKRAGGTPEIFTSLALAQRREELIGGVPVHRFPYCYPFLGLSAADRAAMDKKGGNLLSLSLFRSLLSQRGVRLFHAHALKRLGGEVRTAARLRRKPFVVSLHGGVFDVPAAELDQLLKPIAHKPEWGKVFGALFGSRRILEDADQVICVGQSELEKAKTELSHDRIDAQKNQLLLLEAFAQFRAERPEALLVLVGPETQPEYAAKLRATIAANHLGGTVSLLQGLRNDDPDLVNAYHACDVFVLPSMHEPFGIVVLEAWSAGRAVIVNHVGGLKALVREGENGLFINPGAAGTAPELAARLGQLAGAPALRQALGKAGREEAFSRYDWSRIARELERHYVAAEAQADRRYGRGRG